jgi:hypothetical protein
MQSKANGKLKTAKQKAFGRLRELAIGELDTQADNTANQRAPFI